MNKVRIIWLLICYLFKEPHSNGLKAGINRRDDVNWFIVEPAYIMVNYDEWDNPIYEYQGKRYVKVGGGEQQGKYIYIGEA